MSRLSETKKMHGLALSHVGCRKRSQGHRILPCAGLNSCDSQEVDGIRWNPLQRMGRNNRNGVEENIPFEGRIPLQKETDGKQGDDPTVSERNGVRHLDC